MRQVVLDIGSVERFIDAYKGDRNNRTLERAWSALVWFWENVSPESAMIGREVDRDSVHYRLTYRLLAAFEHVGLIAGTDEAADMLHVVTSDVFSSFHDEVVYEEGAKEGDVFARGLFREGEEAHFEDCYLYVDSLKGQIVKSSCAYKPDWKLPIVRVSAKVGRNDPCPCGSSKKYKRCCVPA